MVTQWSHDTAGNGVRDFTISRTRVAQDQGCQISGSFGLQPVTFLA